jgi:hypothetical protein
MKGRYPAGTSPVGLTGITAPQEQLLQVSLFGLQVDRVSPDTLIYLVYTVIGIYLNPHEAGPDLSMPVRPDTAPNPESPQ